MLTQTFLNHILYFVLAPFIIGIILGVISSLLFKSKRYITREQFIKSSLILSIVFGLTIALLNFAVAYMDWNNAVYAKNGFESKMKSLYVFNGIEHKNGNILFTFNLPSTGFYEIKIKGFQNGKEFVVYELEPGSNIELQEGENTLGGLARRLKKQGIELGKPIGYVMIIKKVGGETLNSYKSYGLISSTASELVYNEGIVFNGDTKSTLYSCSHLTQAEKLPCFINPSLNSEFSEITLFE